MLEQKKGSFKMSESFFIFIGNVCGIITSVLLPIVVWNHFRIMNKKEVSK